MAEAAVVVAAPTPHPSEVLAALAVGQTGVITKHMGLMERMALAAAVVALGDLLTVVSKLAVGMVVTA